MTIFNRYEHVARALLREHPLDYVRIAPGDRRLVHLAVLGFDAFGEAVTVRAALLGHFANLESLKLTIVDPQAQAKGEAFLRRYPQWGRVVRCTFLTDDPASLEVAHRIGAELDPSQDVLGTVVVSLPDDGAALPIAFDLRHAIDPSVPIRAVPQGSAGIASLEGSENWPEKLTIFGEVQARAYGNSWKDEELDSLARAAHEDYVEKLPADKKRDPKNRSALPWELLDDEFVESNRQLADHIPGKLRALALRAVPQSQADRPAVEQFEPEEVEILATMEHRRWMAERFLAGWDLGPKDPDARRSPYLIDFDQLPPDIQDYDRNTVRLIPALMARAGKVLIR